MTKTVDGMTEAERFRYWSDLAAESWPPEGFKVATIDESMDGRTLTVILEKKDDSDGRETDGSGDA